MSVMGDSPSPGTRQHRRRGHEGDHGSEQPGGRMHLEVGEHSCGEEVCTESRGVGLSSAAD